jgi:hypothetical protein
MLAVLSTPLTAQMVLGERLPDPALIGGGVIGGLFTDRPSDAVSPLARVTFAESVTVGAVTVFTTDLFNDYPVGNSGTAVLNIFVGETLPLGSNTLNGGQFGIASTPVDYVATASGLEITASGLDITLPAAPFLIGITPILNFAANGQEFFQDAGANGQTTFLNNPGGALFIPIYGTETINANIVDTPTPFTGMAIRITGPNDMILKGDVNGDGQVNLLDVAPFVAAVSSGQFIPEADVNCDGAVNLLDVSPFVALLSGG